MLSILVSLRRVLTPLVEGWVGVVTTDSCMQINVLAPWLTRACQAVESQGAFLNQSSLTVGAQVNPPPTLSTAAPLTCAPFCQTFHFDHFSLPPHLPSRSPLSIP